MINFFLPTRLIIGEGALDKLSEQKLCGDKAIIVTYGDYVKQLGYLDRTIEQLKKAGVESVVYDGVTPNPTKDEVHEGAAMARQFGAKFVVGLGGGSAIDTAKAVAIMSTNEGDFWDYVPGGTGLGKEFPNDPLPVIAITTTAGTGTEADPWMVITKTETNEKIGSGNDRTYPYLAIVDPALMVTVPPRLTAFQGFDALFHSTEGYLNKNANDLSDIFALKAIELVGKSLVNAVKNGKDMQARTDIALANTLSGINEHAAGTISAHSLAHAMSAVHSNMEHGASLVATSIAYYTMLAQSGQCDEKMIKMAKLIGKPDAKSASDFVDALAALISACGVDDVKLSDYGFKYEELEMVAKHARYVQGGLYFVDPITVTDEAMLEVLQKSYK